jgi:hypothetical protein
MNYSMQEMLDAAFRLLTNVDAGDLDKQPEDWQKWAKEWIVEYVRSQKNV